MIVERPGKSTSEPPENVWPDDGTAPDSAPVPLTGFTPGKGKRPAPASPAVKPGKSPAVKAPEKLPYEPVGELIMHPVFGGRFQRGYRIAKDGTRIINAAGKPQHCIYRIAKGKEGITRVCIWLGDIEVIGQSLAYVIEPSRRLKAPQWHGYTTVRITNESGDVRIQDIANMDLRQMVGKANWPDALGVTNTGRITYIKEFIQMVSNGQNTTLIIRGQGPLYLDDKSPNNSMLNREQIFVSRSVIYDKNGEPRNDIRADLRGIPDDCDYYDVTPLPIPGVKVREGIELFRLSYAECTPEFTSLPAAMNGQLFTGFIVALDPRYFSAIGLFGKKGSGKSRYANRFDAVQGNDPKKTRGDLRLVMPAINLGDQTGTAKGPKYNITNYGGFSITTDDVLREGDTEATIRTQSDKVSNMVRSMEAGGAPLAGVNYAINEVEARKSPALHSSIRVLAEIPIIIPSTLDRMIMLPLLPSAFGAGDVFRQDIPRGLSNTIVETLGTPENRELMHLAYSAYVPWAFAHWHSLMEACYEKALAITATWGISNSRIPERYSAIIAGNLMFAEFAAGHHVDITSELDRGIESLRLCAIDQAGATVPEFVEFAKRLRALVMRHKISIPGPPEWNNDGQLDKEYSDPGVFLGDSDDKTKSGRYEYPDGIGPDELGLVIEGGSIRPPKYGSPFIAGYLIPPRIGTRGIKGNPLTYDWHIAFKHERFAELCVLASRDNRAFDPKSVMHSAGQMQAGAIEKLRLGNSSKQARYWIIDAQVLNPAGKYSDDESEREAE
jgi:hypothetical protein